VVHGIVQQGLHVWVELSQQPVKHIRVVPLSRQRVLAARAAADGAALVPARDGARGASSAGTGGNRHGIVVCGGSGSVRAASAAS
jgi:hypothetical protein